MAEADADKNNMVLLMTTGKRGPDRAEDVVRIDRVSKAQLDKSKCRFMSNGTLTGVVVNNMHDLPDVKSASVEMDFTACLFKSEAPHKKRQEQRLLRFWFSSKTKSQSTRIKQVQLYFKHLVKPERFPTDYVSFIQKAVLLARHFPLFSRVELVIRPRPEPESSCTSEDSEEEEEEEDIVEEAMCRRQHYNQRMKKWAKLDRPPSDEEDVEVSDETLNNYITILSPTKYDYIFLPDIEVNRKPFLTFRVKAQCEAHIALSTLYGDVEYNTYEILIGGWNNTKSVIRNGAQGPIIEEAVTPKILDAHVFRAFWIRWSRRLIEVGLGHKAGEKVFLRCFIPRAVYYHINSMAVTTGPGSAGEWELIEKLVPENESDNHSKRALRARMQESLMLEAKRRQLIDFLGNAYPSRISTLDLLRFTKTKTQDGMKIVAILRALVNNGEVLETTKGVWLLSHTTGLKGSVQEISTWPKVNLRDSPSVLVVTTRLCEKLSVDAVMDCKMTCVKRGEKGDFAAVTMGRIDGRPTVHVKLSQPMNAHSKQVLSGLLGHFSEIRQAYLIGVGGAVPHFSDYEQHVRLGDVVVSIPSRERRPVHIHCEKVSSTKFGRYQYTVDTSWMTDDLLQGHAVKARDMADSRMSSFRTSYERILDKALRDLKESDKDFGRPDAKYDRLFGYVDGEYGPIEHPQAPSWRDGRRFSSRPKSNFRFGPIGSGKVVAKDSMIRMDYAQQYELAAYDTGAKEVLNILQKFSVENYLVIRGMADYVDGSTKKRWQPFAALSAAAFLKMFLTILPRERY